MSPSNRFGWLQSLALVGVAAAFAVAVTPTSFSLDAAYITLHSARVVLSGHDAVFDAPALTGVTSPVYAAILTALVGAGIFDELVALRVAVILGVLAYVSAVWALLAAAGIRDWRLRAAAN